MLADSSGDFLHRLDGSGSDTNDAKNPSWDLARASQARIVATDSKWAVKNSLNSNSRRYLYPVA